MINHKRKEIELDFSVRGLSGCLFLITASSVYFKNSRSNPSENLGIIQISDDGKHYKVLWGFENGKEPTSELSTHLKCQEVNFRKDKKQRIILHTHPSAILAMTFIHELDDREWTKTLWKMMTESLIVFPDGVTALPWMIAGENDIGEATAKKLRNSRVIIWAHHGIIASGQTIDDALGLVETVEKAAEIYLKIKNSGQPILQEITDGELFQLASAFHVEPKEGYLSYEKES